MTLTEYPDLEQRSEEWFAARCGLVTASMVGKLITPTLKVADNDTSRGILTTLAAERLTGHIEETPMTRDMERGVFEEPFARDYYVENYAPVKEVGFMVRAFGNGVRIGCSPDGLVGDDGGIEIKSRRQKKHVVTVLSGQVPTENMAQCQTFLLVTGREWIDYCSFSGGMHFWTKRVFPDPQWQDVVLAAATTAEDAIANIVHRYTVATNGLPVTERILDLDELVI